MCTFKVDPGTLSAPTTTLTFTQVAGGAAPAAQTIAVTGSPAALNFTVTSSTQNGVQLARRHSGFRHHAGQCVRSRQRHLARSRSVHRQRHHRFRRRCRQPHRPSPWCSMWWRPARSSAAPTTLSFAYTIGQTAAAAQNLADLRHRRRRHRAVHHPGAVRRHRRPVADRDPRQRQYSGHASWFRYRLPAWPRAPTTAASSSLRRTPSRPSPFPSPSP